VLPVVIGAPPSRGFFLEIESIFPAAIEETPFDNLPSRVVSEPIG